MSKEKLNSLKDLFEHELQDLYSAESQLIAALPQMAEKANDSKLKKALEDHLKETEKQKERLEEICDMLDVDPKGEKCKAMEGLIKEAKSILETPANPEVLDAAIIASAQRVEHYEIAGYGTLCTYAKSLGHDEVADILEKTLTEEKNADAKLNKIALGNVNKKAEKAG